MNWSKKIELIIAISFLLLFLPCLYVSYFKAEFQSKKMGMSILFSTQNIICLEIAILLLIASYFALKGFYFLEIPNVELYSHCYSSLPHSRSNFNGSKNANEKKRQLSQEEE